eukprot:XP_001175945.2 PREDICTED: uncharacterized protein LOC752337 [Strongylocentrotus purpuratus]
MALVYRYPRDDSSESDSEIWSGSEDEESDDADLREIAAAAAAGTIQPYQYEPLAPETPVLEEGAKADLDKRLGNNNWCSCNGGCEAMPTARESVCCKEVEKVIKKMDEYMENNNLKCITEHPGFRTVCLDEHVLDVAYYQYRQQYDIEMSANDERYQLVAHRQLARWCWEYLGRHVGVPLPSCAVVKIRQAFPSASNKNT